MQRDLGSPYKGGYKFPNGLPMRDDLKEQLDKLYDLSVKQGNTQTREELYAQYGDLIADTLFGAMTVDGRRIRNYVGSH